MGTLLVLIALARIPAIELIDLAHDQTRQVIVDREPGQYLGQPTTVLLDDRHTLIAVYPKGHGRGAIVMKRSADGGRTWSARLPVPDNWATSAETPTIHRVTDAQGAERLLVFSGLHPIRMAMSADHGATWTPLAPIASSGGSFGGIVAMASLEHQSNGDHLALFHDDGRFLHAGGASGPFRVYATVSKDHGATWSAPIVIATHAEAQLCEPGLVRSPDGKQLAVLLRENSRTRHSFLITSDDEGKTWSAPVELPLALTGDRHVARYAPDGRLVVTFRDMAADSGTRGDWVAWVGTYDDVVHGRDGQYRVRLMDNLEGTDCGYAGLAVLPDGAFVATSYGRWVPGEPPFIVSVRFTLAELDALRPHALFDGKSLDGWKITEFGGQGEVAVRDGTIVLGMGNDLTGINFAGTVPHMNYEVTLEAMRVAGHDFFCGLTFPVGDSCCSLIVGGWAGPVVGLSCVDGRDASENQTTKYQKFETGRWYRVRLRVSRARIEAWIDDAPFVDVSTIGHTLAVRAEVIASQPFGIASWRTTAALRDIEIKPLAR